MTNNIITDLRTLKSSNLVIESEVRVGQSASDTHLSFAVSERIVESITGYVAKSDITTVYLSRENLRELARLIDRTLDESEVHE